MIPKGLLITLCCIFEKLICHNRKTDELNYILFEYNEYHIYKL